MCRDKEAANARELQKLVLSEMDKYWTPFEGHKLSVAATCGKWSDLLFVAQSCLRTAQVDETVAAWTAMELSIAQQLEEFRGALQEQIASQL